MYIRINDEGFGYRSGQWAEITAIQMWHPSNHPCYIVKFIDGATDHWPVYASGYNYEFNSQATSVDSYKRRE